jgi:hypothetical protein
MRTAAMAAAALLALGMPAWAADAGDVTAASGGIFSTLLKIIVKWVFPVCAAYCFLSGVIGKGVKRGEWDMAAVSTIAAVALALFPKLLTSLFGVQL